MKKHSALSPLALACSAWLALLGCGCSPDEAAKTVDKAERSAQEAAKTVADDTGDLMKKGGEMASELGDKALAYLSPLKEKFGSLEKLKESPEQLKQAVTELIRSIEDKGADIKLPEAMSKTLEAVTEKLMALKDYLGGEVEQAKIDEHVQSIMDSVKSGLGMSRQ